MHQKKSLWQTENEQYPSLSMPLKVKTVIVGGGLSGLSIAYYLSQHNRDFIVVEAKKIGSGVSGKTTAHVTYQHDNLWQHYIKTFGLEKTKLIFEANKEAITEIERIINIEKMDCDFISLPSVLFSLKDEKKIEEEYKAAKQLGIDCKFDPLITELPFLVKASLLFSNQASFNPIKYLRGLANAVSKKGIKIFEDSTVTKVEKSGVIVNGHKIEAENIVLATHNPIIDFPGLFFSKHYYQISNVVAGINERKIKNLYNCIDNDGYTYRQYKNYLLIAGCDYHPRSAKKCYRMIEQEASLFNTQARYYWSAEDGTSLDKLPYIGKIKKSNYYIATGYGKWGMTNSNIAGRVISELILNKFSVYETIFSPGRKKGLAAYGSWGYNFLVTLYHHTTGLIHFGQPRCSHLKCRLHFQKETETYDCPCHGSMFDKDGNVIDGPAKKKIKLKK